MKVHNHTDNLSITDLNNTNTDSGELSLFNSVSSLIEQNR